MIKLRIQGVPGDVDEFVESLERHYQFLSKSGHYQNRNSDYVRVYIDVDDETDEG